MSEILTESFCERCGTRYTFESARPKVRLKGVKVLSRGLKNFVLSDDTTMDEAMAAARSETDRESTAHQLDAFHKTFNFCMSCRQYTCPNCWNEVEARCQSCAPLPELEIAAPDVTPPVFPGLEPLAGSATFAEPATNGANGQDHDDRQVGGPGLATEPAAKAAGQTSGLLSRFRPGQNLDDELAAFEREHLAAAPETAAIAGAPEAAAPEAAAPETAAIAEPEPTPETVEAVEAAALLEAEPALDAAASAPTEPVLAADATLVAEAPAEVEATAAADGTSELEAAPHAQDELAAAAHLEPAPIEPVAAEPASVEPMSAAAPDVQLEPVETTQLADAEPATSPADVVEQPTWRITAPDLDAAATGAPARPGEPAPLQPTPPTAEPQWPAKPEWPAPRASTGLPFLGRPAQPQGGVESLWAASNRELVTTPPPPGRTTSGIQPCISCGLSLSANARFCRRCGTLQGG